MPMPDIVEVLIPGIRGAQGTPGEAPMLPANTLIGNDTNASALAEALSVSEVKTLLSLNNVDNTADANKPVSTAQAAAINAKPSLGETQTDAYRGDRGKTAYDHSQTLGNPHGLAWSDISGSVLAAVWLQITIASGGPPVLGATMQDNGGQSFVWSAFTFYVDTEEGFLTLTEDNQLEIVE